MSLERTVEITCPKCSTTQQMQVWSSVNARLDPQLKEEILQQRLNVFFCEQCDFRGAYDESLLYHDMDGKYCVQYVAKEDMKNPKFYQNLTKEGTVIFDPVSTKIIGTTQGGHFTHPHHVFSMKEMLLYILFRTFCVEYGKETNSDSDG